MNLQVPEKSISYLSSMMQRTASEASLHQTSSQNVNSSAIMMRHLFITERLFVCMDYFKFVF